LLYGSKWADTGWVLSLLFLSVPAFVCLGLSTPVLWNSGRKHHEVLLQVPVLMLGALGFYYAIPYGIHAFALMASVLIIARSILVCASVFHLLQIGMADAAPALLRGTALSAVVAAVALAGAWSVNDVGSPLLNLVVSGSLAVVVVGGLVFARPGLVGIHAISMIARFSQKAGDCLNRRLR